MSSLVESLGTRLRSIGQDLPLAELQHAAARLRDATGRFGQLMHESGHTEWIAELTEAAEHLDRAIAATGSALHGLDGYLTGIGLGGVPQNQTSAGPTAAVPAPAPAIERADPAMASRAWWAERVDLLTQHAPDPQRPATVRSEDTEQRRNTPEDLPDALRRLVGSARRSGRDGYRAQLLATHPATGLQLPAPGARVLRHLATGLLGHPPGRDDARPLADRCTGRVRELLPAIAPDLPARLVAEVCGQDVAAQSSPHHPVDTAASWPVIVAVVLAATGRDDVELVALSTVSQQKTDDTARRDGR